MDYRDIQIRFQNSPKLTARNWTLKPFPGVADDDPNLEFRKSQKIMFDEKTQLLQRPAVSRNSISSPFQRVR